MVDELRGDGTTVLLTTQYLEEADRLAQRIAVVDHGRIVAEGTADRAQGARSARRAERARRRLARIEDARRALPGLGSAERRTSTAADGEIRLAVEDPGASAEAVRRLDARQLTVAAVELHQPTLDDVFLTLTGHPADEASTEPTLEQEAA